ncbi:MAG: dihydropteroate synthase [Spirochaetaceae bacterium]|nr:dihydropteroate synthase [Spirochaetaceae bacterium]
MSSRHPTGLPGHLAVLDRTLVMGVVNVTPDSFSDGGAYLAPDAAVEHGLLLRDEGADIVDVGGESTRPGAGRVDADEELRRVLPVVRGLVSAGVVVSIDTMRSAVADAALEAGAGLVNDVSGGLADPDMARVVAGSDTPYVVMHWRGHSADMASRAVYDDVVADVVGELRTRVDALVGAGVDPARLVLDPGLGFAKDAGHNWSLLRHLDVLGGLGRPLLVGASRKGFLGALLAGPDGDSRPAEQRDVATAALSALLAADEVWGLRVHAVRPTVDALRVADALRSARVDG